MATASRFALIKDDVLIGIIITYDIVHDEESILLMNPGATLIQNDDVQADWIYNPADGTVNPPPPLE